MKKTVRLFVWIFAAGLLAVAVGFIISLNSRLSRYRQAYEIGYRRAFSELVGSVANIDAYEATMSGYPRAARKVAAVLVACAA